MDVSNRFEELLERIIVKHEENVDDHQGAQMIDKLLAAYRGENAQCKITRKNVNALAAVNVYPLCWTIILLSKLKYGEI